MKTQEKECQYIVRFFKNWNKFTENYKKFCKDFESTSSKITWNVEFFPSTRSDSQTTLCVIMGHFFLISQLKVLLPEHHLLA